MTNNWTLSICQVYYLLCSLQELEETGAIITPILWIKVPAAQKS